MVYNKRTQQLQYISLITNARITRHNRFESKGRKNKTVVFFIPGDRILRTVHPRVYNDKDL